MTFAIAKDITNDKSFVYENILYKYIEYLKDSNKHNCDHPIAYVL